MIDFSINNTLCYGYGKAEEKQFSTLEAEINQFFGVVVKNKIAVGCMLCRIWSHQLYRIKLEELCEEYDLYHYRYRNCHQNVFYAVCDKFFSLDKKEVQLYMNVADSFVDKETYEIKPKYKDFKWYQLVEMVPLSEEQRAAIDPSWPRQKIRDYKKTLAGPKEEKKRGPVQDEIWLGQDDNPEPEQEDSEEAYDEEIYKRELGLLPKKDVIDKAVEHRRLCFELQQQVIALSDELGYYKRLAIEKVS